MTIPAIGAAPAVSATSYLPASTAGSTTESSDTGFASALTGAVNNLQQLQSTSNSYAIQAVTGDLDDIHTATIASSRAAVTLELVAAVRNKGVEAFNDIMRMQA
ncbi:flagellar hook-basal body complex protein FliE [Cryobacterium sp. MP_3.1]|uniref:Flagellar hook-basal body complex protein FliE n=1 Tax=Cryobacterium zongtaii TaxID=1259217 RepID=A0A2S3Z7A3_9MICO|nr:MULTISPECIES: flagellar hook-basal body complex protein FliE [Cryobacterium]MEC5184693.1 flagellar hook-basal body complex protein FliE [Cryobacterium sp. MP_3.1]POH61458.1 flagellar hook-basal body complex protein FliE [Cryobacterium zongtaii]